MPATTGQRARGDQLLAYGALLGRSGKIIESEISGTSMGSNLPSGCRIRIRPLSFSDYEVGQVVAFVSGDRIFAHRIICRSHRGVLTRGDNHSWCDLPVPSKALLGEVTEYQVDGEWRSLGQRGTPKQDRPKGITTIELLLCLCMQIDIQLATYASRAVSRLARWSRRSVTSSLGIT